jgi:hypothetical protein
MAGCQPAWNFAAAAAAAAAASQLQLLLVQQQANYQLPGCMAAAAAAAASPPLTHAPSVLVCHLCDVVPKQCTALAAATVNHQHTPVAWLLKCLAGQTHQVAGAGEQVNSNLW